MRFSRIQSSIVLSAAFLLLFSLSEASAGSPFYLTVGRSFSVNESPQIRLDYIDSSKPLLIRVLRPKNLELFLEGQFNISRSYEKPVSELNPGYYFVTGLNQVESPLRAFREMLDNDFRKSLKETPFHKAIVDTSRREVASAPDQMVHAPPQGLDTVREYYVDLRYGGTGVNDLGWWFWELTWQEWRYKVRMIKIDPLPDGLYLIQAVQGKSEAQCLLQVSSLSVQVKQSTEQLIVRVINRHLEPVAGATVSYRDARGKWIDLNQKTNPSGEAILSSSEGLDGRLLVRVRTRGKGQAFVDTDFLPAVPGNDSVFIMTDRPIFKPGETFFYKGVVRTFDRGNIRIPTVTSKEAQVSLIRFDGTPTDLQARAPVTDFGSFSGSLALDETQPPGLYRLVARIDDKPYGGEFRVRDYVKPTFYLDLIERSPTVVQGESFFVKFRAKRYSGGVPRDVKYEVFLYRKKFEAPPWVAEAGGGLAAGTDYFGQLRSASALTEPTRIFSSVEERLARLSEAPFGNSWASAPKTDDSGEALFQFDIPKIASKGLEEWIYTLIVRAMDPAGSQAVLTENIYVTLSEAQVSVRFLKPLVRVGEKGLPVAVRSTYPDGKSAPKGRGTIELCMERGGETPRILLQAPFTTDDQGLYEIALPELTQPGRLTALATLEMVGGKPMRYPAKSEPGVAIVAGAPEDIILDNRELEIYASSTILSPGEKAKIFALLPAGWGQSESGTVWETVAGHRIHETRTTTFQGRSRWFEVKAKSEYGTGFYHTVTVPMKDGKYAERTLGFRIIPLDRRLMVSVLPERREAEPLKPFRIHFEVKDAEGRASAKTELAVAIVDRAVYAVQSEIRPEILDFFYPLPRLNVATFYSDELQGYGYADLLKKPNFKLGALKSQSKLTKKALRDTAGWFPHVVTDARGRASVTVDLPANVTEWVITAVAVDREGRMGEARGAFRTASDVSVEALAPQFLRRGEEALLQIRTINHLEQSVSLKSQIEISGEASLKQDRREEPFLLPGKAERLLPLTLRATGEKGTATLKVALSAQEKILLAGAEEFEIPLKPAAMRQVFAGMQRQDKLISELPETARVRDLKVQVSSGLLGAALHAAPVLLSYPYGCTEQLVHTTIPNLVLIDLVKRAGIHPRDLGPLAGVFAKAEANAALGIKKILKNQRPDGGFGLWQSDPESSMAVTVTALYALKIASDLKIGGAGSAFYSGSAWISRQVARASFDAVNGLHGYELSRISQVLGRQADRAQVAYVEAVQKEPSPPIDRLIYALRMFAAHKDISWGHFVERFKESTVREELVERLKRALERFDPEAYLTGARADGSVFESLGFGFGIPSAVSGGMGVLAELNALPEPLELRLKKILLSYLKNGFWISTFETAQVIFNTRSILSKEAEAFAREKETRFRRIKVRKKDGAELGELVRIPAGFAGNFANPGLPANLMEIELLGLEATDTALSSITADVPYSAVRHHSRGLMVKRTFRRITATGSEVLDLSRPLRKGDRVVSEVLVRRESLRSSRVLPSRFVVIEDGVPSFAQAIDDDQTYLADAKIQPGDETYWGSVKETQRYPEKTVRIARILPGGELKLYQVWQVAFPGNANLPPARVFDMYDESIQGNTEAVNVRSE